MRDAGDRAAERVRQQRIVALMPALAFADRTIADVADGKIAATGAPRLLYLLLIELFALFAGETMAGHGKGVTRPTCQDG